MPLGGALPAREARERQCQDRISLDLDCLEVRSAGNDFTVRAGKRSQLARVVGANAAIPFSAHICDRTRSEMWSVCAQIHEAVRLWKHALIELKYRRPPRGH